MMSIREQLETVDGVVVVEGPWQGGAADLRAHRGDDVLANVGIVLAANGDVERRVRAAETFSHKAILVVGAAPDGIADIVGVPVVVTDEAGAADALDGLLDGL